MRCHVIAIRQSSAQLSIMNSWKMVRGVCVMWSAQVWHGMIGWCC